MEDLISVIVPVYRVETYLEQCIQSIQNQTYRNLEIILVDDGSDDHCPQICDRHALKDRRIKVIHKENGGPDSARKAGMKVASGKYVGYVDGDDWIEPEMYAKLLLYMNRYQVEIVESGVIDSYINTSEKRVTYIKEGCYIGEEFIEKVEPRILYAGDFFEHGISPYLCSKLFLRDRIIEFQMMEGLINIIHDDTMVSLPCIAKSKKLYISHECFYHYRVNRFSLKRKCREDEVTNLIKCYPEFYTRFKKTVLSTKKDKQIKYYVMYWLLYKAPYMFDQPGDQNFLTPFGNINKNARIVLYGAGAAGMHLENYIRSVKESNLVCWVDQNYKELHETMEVIAPEEIIHYEYDFIIISIMRERAVQSAKRNLIEMGVPEEKIIWIMKKYIDDPDLLLQKVDYEQRVCCRLGT